MGPDAQENAGDQVAIGFHSSSDWLARVLETNRYWATESKSEAILDHTLCSIKNCWLVWFQGTFTTDQVQTLHWQLPEVVSSIVIPLNSETQMSNNILIDCIITTKCHSHTHPPVLNYTCDSRDTSHTILCHVNHKTNLCSTTALWHNCSSTLTAWSLRPALWKAEKSQR